MSEHAKPNCPPQILEWIAWYPDGGLTDAQRGAVEVHAADCASCREELAILAERADATASPADPDQLFERVLARIETSAVMEEPEAAVPELAREAAGPLRGAPARRRRGLSWQRRGAIAAAGFALVALAGALGWLGRDWVSPVGDAGAGEIYRTASESAPIPIPDTGVALDVVFRSETSAEQINTVLRGLGATVAAGPTELGRYRLALPAGSDARAAAALLRAEGTGVASYAEPVQP
jgi:anti-sigma factor RsiW